MAARKLPVDAQAAIEKCELCQQEQARFFCEDCREEMCKLCKKVHLRSKASRNHNVISIAAETDMDVGNRKPQKSIKCSAHHNESIQMYCITCDLTVCHTCISEVKHKNHSFNKLENALDKCKKEMSQIISEKNQQISELETSLQSIDTNIKDYTEESDQAIEGINKQRKQIKSQVDRIADGHVEEVQKRRIQDVKLAEKERKEVQKLFSEQKEYLKSYEEKLKSMNDFSCIGQQIKKSPMPCPPSITRIKPPTFVSNTTPDLQEIFGRVIDIQEQTPTQRMSANKDKKGMKRNTIAEDKACGTSVNISTKVVVDISPGITCESVSAINNKEAWCGGGKDLALIHIDGKVKKKIKLDNSFSDIAVSSAGELFITEIDGTNIKKYLPDNKKFITIADTKPYWTMGLCVTSQQDILVCLYICDDDNKVVRMTVAGQIKQTIQTDKHGKSLFKEPRLVEENINGDVCVEEMCYPSTIVVVNKEGVLRFRYPESAQSSHTISGCGGIACDKLGYILISDYNNHRIHQIDSDGRFVKYVLDEQHGIHYPWRLNIDDKGQLWVCNNNCNKIRVIKYRS